MIRRLTALILILPFAAYAQKASVRLEDHPHFSRIVISRAVAAKVALKHVGDRLEIRSIGGAPRPVVGRAALVLHSATTPSELVLDLMPSASIRQTLIGSRRIIDVFAMVRQPEPVRGSALAAPPVMIIGRDLIPGLPDDFGARIENARILPPDRSTLPPASTIEDAKGPGSIGPPANNPSTRPQDGDGAGAGVPTQAIAVVPVPSNRSSRSLFLPFSMDAGVAVLRHAQVAIIFFDEARPLDLSGFKADPVLDHATVSMMTNSTELILPVATGQELHLSRQAAGWRLTMGRSASDAMPIDVVTSGTELHFRMRSPGKVVTAVDPVTGALLLVGTDREAAKANPVARRSAEFVVDRSEIGLVIEPFSDRLLLRPVRDGFSLFREDGRSLHAFVRDMAGRQVVGLAGVTRFLDFSSTATDVLTRQLQQNLSTAAMAAPRARFQPRLAAAQTLIGLSMGREAHTLLRVAFADEPVPVNDARARFLKGLADFLADPGASASLTDPALPANDEVRLWQALATPPTSPPGPAATVIRSDLTLLLSYPDHLRDTAAGLAAPLLLADAQVADLDAIQRLPTGQGTKLEKVLALSIGGRTADTLARLDVLARDRDEKLSADAALQAVDLRVTRNSLSPAAAAEILEKRRLDWRAIGREGIVLMREADLRSEVGELAKAFEIWRDVERRFPELAAQAQSKILEMLSRLAQPDATTGTSPADFVLIVSDCAHELASREQMAAKIAPILADRLEALDLPARATAILQQVMDASTAGPARAELGAKLASLLIEERDAPAALSALDRSGSHGLPPSIDHDRHLAFARAFELESNRDAALSALQNDEGAEAQDLRSEIDASAGRWHDAKLVLSGLCARIPGSGLLDREQAEMVIRFATAASRDGDTDLVLKLARTMNGRFPQADQQRTFGLLTSPLMQSPAPAAAAPGTG